MSGNIPIGGNNRIVKPQTNSNVAGARTVHTRALGSNASSIFPNDWRPAARGADPNDTQRMRTGLYGRMRAGANAHAMGRSFGGMTMNATQQTNGMSDMEKAAFAIAMGKMGVELGKGIADIVNAFSTEKSDGAAPKVKDGTTSGSTPGSTPVSTATTISSENASFVSDMTSATDAASLESAIGNAEAKLNEINGSLEGLKSSAEIANGELERLGREKESKLAEFRKADAELTAANKSLKGAKGALSNAKIAFENACGATAQAREAYALAKGETLAAESNLAAVQTQYDAAPEEQKPALAKALADAQRRLADAKREEDRTLKARNEAIGAEGQANEELKAKENQLAVLQKTVLELEDKVETLEKQKAEINKELDALQKDINAADADIRKYETAKKDAEALEAQINQQKPRLAQMRATEKAKLEGLQSDNAQLYAGIDGQVDTLKEKISMKQVGKNDKEIAEMFEIAQKGIMKGNPEATLAGVEFRTGKGPDGSDIYMIGDKAVTKGEYDNKKVELTKLDANISTMSSYQEGTDMPEGFTKIIIEDLCGVEQRQAQLADGSALYIVDGKQVSAEEYTNNEKTKLALSVNNQINAEFDVNLTVGGTPVSIGSDKFAVTADGKYKINGKDVTFADFKKAIGTAKEADKKASAEAKLDNLMVQAQITEGGTTIKNSKGEDITVDIQIDNSGKIVYKLGVMNNGIFVGNTYNNLEDLRAAIKAGGFTI